MCVKCATDPSGVDGLNGSSISTQLAILLFPKSGGTWPPGVSLIEIFKGLTGADGGTGTLRNGWRTHGSDGLDGTNGLNVLNGTTDPAEQQVRMGIFI